MDVLTIIQIALFVPFFLVLTIFAIVYLINGYKKDFGRSLISLSATIISIVISLLMAKGISWLIAAPVVSLLPAEVTEFLAEFGTLGSNFAQGIIEVALSFLLFCVFFIAGLAVLKSVGKKIQWNKLENLNTGKKSTRLAGMGIRTVDAILVSMMLLLPLYGTLAMAAPPAATLVRMSESSVAPQQRSDALPDPAEVKEISTLEILEAVANHPILAPYKYGPGAWVYSGLSSFSMNGQTVDITTAVNSLEGMLDRLQNCRSAIEAEDAEDSVSAIQELIDYTRNEVINQRWSYNMVMAFVGEIDTMVEEYAEELSDEEDLLEMYGRLRPLLDMSFEEYTNNAEVLLDFAGWVIEIYGQYGDGNVPDKEVEKLQKELYVRLGNLLNHSEQAVALKQILLQMFAQEMFDVLPDAENPDYADYYAARKNLPNSGTAFVNKYFGDGIVSEEDRIAEASAFFSLFGNQNALNTAEAFVRHPLFGADAVLEAMDEYLYIHGIDEHLGQQLAENDKATAAYKALDNKLRSYEKASHDQPLTFSDEVYDYLIEKMGLSDNYYAGFWNPDVMMGEKDTLDGKTVMMGEDGKLYLIPDELVNELLNLGRLDEKTIQKYNLKPLEGVSFWGDSTQFEGDYSDEVHFGGVQFGGEYVENNDEHSTDQYFQIQLK